MDSIATNIAWRSCISNTIFYPNIIACFQSNSWITWCSYGDTWLSLVITKSYWCAIKYLFSIGLKFNAWSSFLNFKITSTSIIKVVTIMSWIYLSNIFLTLCRQLYLVSSCISWILTRTKFQIASNQLVSLTIFKSYLIVVNINITICKCITGINYFLTTD